jgi:hypothetical protein
LTARRDQANPPSVPLTTKPDPPATVQRFYPGPLTQFQSGVDRHCMMAVGAKSRYCLGLAYEASMLKLSSAPAPHAEVFCIPKETKIDQQIRVVVKYIEARPERIHERFALLALLALIEAWPCKS